MLRCTRVTRTVVLPHGEPLHILRGVDLFVDQGEHVSIVGRSGSGKSTLLNLIGLLDQPTLGTVEFDGVDTKDLSERRLARLRGANIGFIFQQFNLLPQRTALENVMMPLMYAPSKQFWNRRAIATELLEKVGLGDRLNESPKKLSGGEQQRVAIARALVRSPRLILADEPTGALDVNTGDRVMGLLAEVAAQRGSSLIVITHDPTIAQRGDRVLAMDQGVLLPTDQGVPVPEGAPGSDPADTSPPDPNAGHEAPNAPHEAPSPDRAEPGPALAAESAPPRRAVGAQEPIGEADAPTEQVPVVRDQASPARATTAGVER